MSKPSEPLRIHGIVDAGRMRARGPGCQLGLEPCRRRCYLPDGVEPQAIIALSDCRDQDAFRELACTLNLAGRIRSYQPMA